MTSDAPRPLPAGLSRHWYNAPDYVPGDPWRSFEPRRVALVLVDLIDWQVDPAGPSIAAMREAGLDEGADHLIRRYTEVIVPNLRILLPAARAAGVQVVHARLASRHEDFGDIVPALRPYVRAAGARAQSAAAAVPVAIGEVPGDLTVFKTGSGAFAGTELDLLLRRLAIDTLLYAGVVTNACVLLSVAAGFDLGYRQYLISDCTGAQTERDQADSERIIGTYLAEIVGAKDVALAFGNAQEARR